MIRLAKLSAPSQKLVRTFQFQSSGRNLVNFDVTLEYSPPETLNDQLEQERVRIIGTRKFGAAEDLQESQLALKTAWHAILASKVNKIDRLTVRKLASLISMDPIQIASIGTGLDATIPMDPADPSPISDEDRKASDIQADVKTSGAQASQNIFFFVNACAEFRNFLETVLKDVGYFQDKDWEAQIKN